MLNSFSKTKILVIGDLMADKYIFGKITKLSFEAPIPIVEVTETELKMGGAALVIENVSLLGARAVLVGMVGNDDSGFWLKNRLKKLGVNSVGLITDKSIRTSLRTRIIAENYQVSRFDDPPQKLNKSLETKIIKNLKHFIPKVDCVIVCDYGKGTLTNNVIKSINQIIKKNRKKIIVSPAENHLKYKNSAFIYRIKLKDAVKLLDIKQENYSIEEVCKKLNSLLKSKKVILTKGDAGLTAYENGRTYDIMATHHTARDVTSVGEVLVSTFAVSYASGMSFEDSCIVGNVAAGTVVEKIGAKNIDKEELEKSLDEYHEFALQK